MLRVYVDGKFFVIQRCISFDDLVDLLALFSKKESNEDFF